MSLMRYLQGHKIQRLGSGWSTVWSAFVPVLLVGLGLMVAWFVGGKMPFQLDESTAIPQSLSTVIVIVLAGVGLFTAKTVFQKPLILVLALLALFFWEALFAKLTQLSFGLAGLAALVLLVKQFNWLWKLPVLRWGLGFALVSAIYYFVYSSSFQLSSVEPGYNAALFKETADAPAKVAVVVWAFSVAIGFITGLGVFIPKKNNPIAASPAVWLQQWGLPIGMALFYLLGTFIVAFPTTMKGGHLNIYLPPTLLFTQFIAGWIRSGVEAGVPLKTPRWLDASQLSQWLGIIVVILWVLFPLLANKTTLVTGFLLIGLQAIFLKQTGLGMQWGWPKLPTVSVLQQMIIMISVGLIGSGLIVATGLDAAFREKMDYFTNGFSNTATLRIREENLHHFFEEWRSNLSPKVLLLGNGLAASRHDIFFVSAQRRWNYGILVQTTHNTYVELFYDYGLMALLFFTMWVGLILSAIKTVGNQAVHPVAKHAAVLILCFAFFFATNGLVDGIVAPCMTQSFTMLGLLEGVRRFWPPLPMPTTMPSHFSQQLLFKRTQQNTL